MKQFALILIILFAFSSNAFAADFPSVGTMSADADSSLVNAYQERVTAWQLNQNQLQGIATRQVSNPDPGYEINGNPTTQADYINYQNLLLEQQQIVAQASQIVEQANTEWPDLPSDASPEDVVQYNDLINEYNETFIDRINDPNDEVISNRFLKIAETLRDYQVLYGDDERAFEFERAEGDAAILTSTAFTDDKELSLNGYKIMLEIFFQLEEVVGGVLYPELSKIARGPFMIMLALWFMFIGVALLRGMQVNAPELIWKIGLIIFWGNIVFVGGATVLYEYVIGPIITTFLSLSGYILKVATLNLNLGQYSDLSPQFMGIAIVESRYLSMLEMANYIYELKASQAGKLNFGAYLAAGMLWLIMNAAFFIIYAIYFALIGYSLLAIYLYAAAAPLVVPLYLFNKTRGFCLQWIKGMLGFLLIPVMSALSIGIFISVLLGTWLDFESSIRAIQSGGSDAFPMSQLVGLLVIALLTYVIHRRIPDWAAHMSGGTTTGLGDALHQAVKSAGYGAAAYYGAKKIGGMAAAGAASTYGKIEDIGARPISPKK